MEDIAYITPPAVLAHLEAKTAEIGFGMASEPRTGALLQVLAASKPGGRLLELGTGTGIATSWLLSGMDAAAKLTTVDNDADLQAIAKEVLDQDPRVTFITTEGAAFLFRQNSACYDLIFADALPGKYEVIEDALALVKPGGFYVVDDMLPQPTWPAGHAEKVPALLEFLADHPDFLVVPMAWASGVVVAVRVAHSAKK